MSGVGGHPDEKKERILSRIASGETQSAVAASEGVSPSTIRLWTKGREIRSTKVDLPRSPPKIPAKILIYDLETLPNLGYFWDTFSDRSLPLEFILKPKAICTIAYKWLHSDETHVLVVGQPYDDKIVLEAFMGEWSQADYTVAHYGDKFDMPFLAARLMANKMQPLPPVATIDTYKLAKARFGRSLNGNRLDHLGTILGVGNKIKTSSDLWVKCAAGDKEALQSMAEYNKQDVDLLAQVFEAMLPYVKSKLNINLMTDEPALKCKSCGSYNIQHKGFEYTPSSMRHKYHCQDCMAWSSFPKRKI